MVKMQETHDKKNSILSMVLDEQVDSINYELNNPEVAKYLDQLCSLGTSQLNGQLKIIEKEEQDLTNSVKQITLKSFPSIVATSNFVNELELDLNDLRNNIHTYQDTLPFFTDKVNIFYEEAMSISKRWRDASLMLNKHSKILEFLEIIQLLDSCLRNAHYDEALKLLNYIFRLNAKHGKNISLIADLANKSIEWKETMMNYLLKELYSSDDIQSYATSIEYLRKLEEFDESEIRLKFLLAKNYKIQNQIKELDHKNLGNYLKRSVELHEKVLLNTYEQYNQLFAEAENARSSFNKMDKFDLDFDDSSLLFSWMMFKSSNLITELRLGLSHLFNENQHFFKHFLVLKNQSDHFSFALSKIGLNFRNHFDQLFNEYLEHDLKLNLNKVIKKFEFSLDSYNITSSHVDPNKLVNHGIDNSSSNQDPSVVELNPPKSIVQFVPLKNLCNELIKLFEKIASFDATSDLIFKFKLLLEEHLKLASNIIEKYIRSETSSLCKANERDLLAHFKHLYKDSLLEYIQKCYKTLINSLTAVDLLGIHSIEFSKIEINETTSIDYTCLNLNEIYCNL